MTHVSDVPEAKFREAFRTAAVYYGRSGCQQASVSPQGVSPAPEKPTPHYDEAGAPIRTLQNDRSVASSHFGADFFIASLGSASQICRAGGC